MPMPKPTSMSWSFTTSMRDCPLESRREVDENMQSTLMSISSSTIIHTTLSPSKFSKMFQMFLFLFAVAAMVV